MRSTRPTGVVLQSGVLLLGRWVAESRLSAVSEVATRMLDNVSVLGLTSRVRRVGECARFSPLVGLHLGRPRPRRLANRGGVLLVFRGLAPDELQDGDVLLCVELHRRSTDMTAEPPRHLLFDPGRQRRTPGDSPSGSLFSEGGTIDRRVEVCGRAEGGEQVACTYAGECQLSCDQDLCCPQLRSDVLGDSVASLASSPAGPRHCSCADWGPSVPASTSSANASGP